MLLKPGGYAVATNADGKKFECDTITCCHCNTVVHVPPKADPNKLFDFCRQCMKPTCAKPECCNGCSSFMRKLEQHEARYHALRSYQS